MEPGPGSAAARLEDYVEGLETRRARAGHRHRRRRLVDVSTVRFPRPGTAVGKFRTTKGVFNDGVQFEYIDVSTGPEGAH